MSSSDPIQSMINDLLIFRENLLFIGMGDYRVEILNLDDFTKIHTITTQTEVRALACNDKYLFVGTLQEEILVYSINGYQHIDTLKHELGVTSLYVDDKFLYSTGFDERVYIHDINNLKLLNILPTITERINTITSLDGVFVTGSGFKMGSSISFFSMDGFKLVDSIEIEAKRVVTSLMHKDVLIIGTGSPPQVQIWNCAEHKPLGRKMGFSKDINSMCESIRYIFVSSGNRIYLYNTTNYEFETSIKDDNDIEVMCSNKDYLIYGARSKLKILDIRSFENIREIDFK